MPAALPASGQASLHRRRRPRARPPNRPSRAGCQRHQRMADGVLQVDEIGFQVAPVLQQKPYSVAVLRLAMRLAEPARSHQMCDAQRIRCVGLVALHRPQRARVHRLQAGGRQGEFLVPNAARAIAIPPRGRTPKSPEEQHSRATEDNALTSLTARSGTVAFKRSEPLVRSRYRSSKATRERASFWMYDSRGCHLDG